MNTQDNAHAFKGSVPDASHRVTRPKSKKCAVVIKVIIAGIVQKNMAIPRNLKSRAPARRQTQTQTQTQFIWTDK